MNKNIKKTVYKILEQDKLAREDDWYLIQQVLIRMIGCNTGTAFGQVLQGMKVQGISFEAITRQRRKFLEENPQLKVQNVEKVRREEEENYYLEYSKHIPRID
mgnify:CR=1 FL=1